jgi:hypothetical protein
MEMAQTGSMNRQTMETQPMKLNWKRIVIAAIWSELVLFAIFQLARRYAGSATEVIVYLDWFGLMLLGGLWVARRIDSRFILHGFLVGIFANILFVVILLPAILGGQLPAGYWIEALPSFVMKIAGSTAGAFIGGIRRKRRLLAQATK